MTGTAAVAVVLEAGGAAVEAAAIVEYGAVVSDAAADIVAAPVYFLAIQAQNSQAVTLLIVVEFHIFSVVGA